MCVWERREGEFLLTRRNRESIQSPGLKSLAGGRFSWADPVLAIQCCESGFSATAVITPSGRGVSLPSWRLELQTESSFHLGKHKVVLEFWCGRWMQCVKKCVSLMRWKLEAEKASGLFLNRTMWKHSKLENAFDLWSFTRFLLPKQLSWVWFLRCYKGLILLKAVT